MYASYICGSRQTATHTQREGWIEGMLYIPQRRLNRTLSSKLQNTHFDGVHVHTVPIITFPSSILYYPISIPTINRNETTFSRCELPTVSVSYTIHVSVCVCGACAIRIRFRIGIQWKENTLKISLFSPLAVCVYVWILCGLCCQHETTKLPPSSKLTTQRWCWSNSLLCIPQCAFVLCLSVP